MLLQGIFTVVDYLKSSNNYKRYFLLHLPTNSPINLLFFNSFFNIDHSETKKVAILI